MIAIRCVPLIAGEDRPDLILDDFESAHYSPIWTVEGKAPGVGPAPGTLPRQNPVSGFLGKRLVNTYLDGDGTTGTLTSHPFRIERSHLAFLIGGGQDIERLGLRLLIRGKVVRKAAGRDDETLDWQTWNLEEFRGQSAVLRIVDHATGGWGHINVDQIVQTDRPPRARIPTDPEEYLEDQRAYRELHRPQFHFTPAIHWMNDPNGLVFHEGEYHLFYQYNPKGNRWGHMSWGHAVSRDLVHWEHLPVALPESEEGMVFSGSAVVDSKNTSGFSRDGKAPLVAIYTAHRKGNQSQCLAYSLDRGRTWTRYAGNPVIDIGLADFRDPKVFWHEPTESWIQIVSRARDKVLHLYGSRNLREWKLLSEFGPGGAPGKPNWECPDLFKLPVEGRPGVTRWVLEVDMGGGSIAGGSGGEYFVGTFDGQRFLADGGLSNFQWVDYGRDFYAPISFSDIPEEDGRRIWVGWINNWETSLIPTSPWRGAQSIPRALSLREVDGQLRLIQRPVQELRRLRQEGFRLESLSLEAASRQLNDRLPRHSLMEVRLELIPGESQECGLKVFQGPDQETRIGYDRSRGEVFVDRTRSGNTNFHPRFAGRHAAPVSLREGKIDLHVFIDTSVVEVFADDGATVITDRIFPDPDQNGWSLYQRGKGARVESLKVWPLNSIWKR